MLINEKINELQNLTKRKITNGEVAKILGLGSGQAIINRVNRKQELKEYEIIKLNDAFKKEINEQTQSNDFIVEDYTNLPIKGNVSASMGCGITVYDETHTGTYAISNQLAKDINANLSQSDIIFAKGDSMEPTIIGGDSLLVDRSKRDVYDGRIYCIRYEGELYAKRLQKLPPNKIKIISDNQAKYDSWYVDFSQDINFDFEVIGEVLWWGRVAK